MIAFIILTQINLLILFTPIQCSTPLPNDVHHEFEPLTASLHDVTNTCPMSEPSIEEICTAHASCRGGCGQAMDLTTKKRLCSCDYLCLLYNDCCFDFTSECPDDANESEFVNSLHNKHFTCVDGYQLVESCTQTNQTTRQIEVDLKLQQTFPLPVTDIYDRVTYRNESILRQCSAGLRQDAGYLTPWNTVRYISEEPLGENDLASFLINGTIPQEEFTSMSIVHPDIQDLPLRFCLPLSEITCPECGVFTFDRKFLLTQCQTFLSPSHDKQNINHLSLEPDTCVFGIVDNIIPGRLSFEVLMKLDHPLTVEFVGDTAGVWSSFSCVTAQGKDCKYNCAPHQVEKDGSCGNITSILFVLKNQEYVNREKERKFFAESLGLKKTLSTLPDLSFEYSDYAYRHSNNNTVFYIHLVLPTPSWKKNFRDTLADVVRMSKLGEMKNIDVSTCYTLGDLVPPPSLAEMIDHLETMARDGIMNRFITQLEYLCETLTLDIQRRQKGKSSSVATARATAESPSLVYKLAANMIVWRIFANF